MTRRFLMFLVLAVILCPAWGQQAGELFPPWSPGILDIHQISTGRGNSALIIFPDGTTALIDAGALPATNNPHSAPPRPDASRTAGEWIARYVRHMLAHEQTPALDYVILTHLHNDHIGSLAGVKKLSRNGAYRLTGITEVAEYVPIRMVIDQAWPDYNYPNPLATEAIRNYRAFLDWQAQHNGLRVERIVPGRSDQIVLRRSAAKYPSFQVRNIAANGEVWTGVGTTTRKHFPPIEDLKKSELPSENMCSLALRISYGKFDYFSGGDMTAYKDEGEPPWRNIERPVAQATGPVDVYLLNHHGHYDSNSAYFISMLRPRVAIMPIWSAAQPDRHVLRRLVFQDCYPGPRDVFATSMTEANHAVLADWMDRLKALEGHVVVRVAPEGDTYKVFVLDNSTESYRIKSVHGPYESR
jgi:beta-lactamase superfamily II metal-dependent hydrolase